MNEARKPAFKVITDKYLKDKRTKEPVKRKFIYVDMKRATESEKQMIQMHINSGYEMKEWDSLKKEPGLNAEMILQYFVNESNKQLAEDIKEEDKKQAEEDLKNYRETMALAKNNYIKELKGKKNFMSIVGDFCKKYVKTSDEKEEILNLEISEDVITEIHNIQQAKRDKRVQDAKKRRDAEKLRNELNKNK